MVRFGPAARANASLAPSGDQFGLWSLCPALMSVGVPVPSALAMTIRAVPGLTVRSNAMLAASGDQAGELSAPALLARA